MCKLKIFYEMEFINGIFIDGIAGMTTPLPRGKKMPAKTFSCALVTF